AVDHAVAALRESVPRSQVSGIAADLGTADGCDDLIKAVPQCDILVNNLGVYGQSDFFKLSDADWFRYFEINVMSGIRLARAYMVGMLQRGWGRIVFVSSEMGLRTRPDMIHYGFTKTAQLAISR